MTVPPVVYRLPGPANADRGSFCAVCGYDLRHSPGGVCPECGADGAGSEAWVASQRRQVDWMILILAGIVLLPLVLFVTGFVVYSVAYLFTGS